MYDHRSGFDCKILLIANCEFFHNSQSKESQVKEILCVTMLVKLSQLSTCAFLHLYPSHWNWDEPCQYFKSTLGLPTPSQVQLLPTQRALVIESSLWLAILLLDWSWCIRPLRVWLAHLAIRNHYNCNLAYYTCMYTCSTIRIHLTMHSKPDLWYMAVWWWIVAVCKMVFQTLFIAHLLFTWFTLSWELHL